MIDFGLIGRDQDVAFRSLCPHSGSLRSTRECCFALSSGYRDAKKQHCDAFTLTFPLIRIEIGFCNLRLIVDYIGDVAPCDRNSQGAFRWI